MEPAAPPTAACAPVRDLLATAVDEPLGVTDRARVDGHLATCAACRRIQRGLAMDASAVARLPQLDAPTRVARRIEEGPRSRSGVGLVVAGAALAFGLILVVGGGWLPLVTGPGTTARPTGVTPTRGLPTTVASVTSAPTDRPATSPTTAPSDAPTTPATPPRTTPAFTGRLSRVESASLDGEAAAWAVVAWQGGAIAVGRRCETPTGDARPCIATRWRTTDIASGQWQEETTGLPSPNADGVAIVGIAASGERLVAVGHARQGDVYEPLIWTSTDGDTWQRIDAPAGVEHGWVASVVAGDDGFVAVGTEIDGDQALATAWHSADGRTWEVETTRPFDGGVKAATPLAADTRRLDYGGMQDIDLRQDGRAVAVGARCRPDGAHCQPRVYVRDPGGRWAAIELDSAADALGELDTVTSVGDRTLALGTDRQGRPIALSSTDLVLWRAMALPAEMGSGAAGFTDAVAAGDQVIAFTSDSTDLAVWRWTPADGWERIGDQGPSGRAIFGSAMIDDKLVVAGRRFDGAALWIADEAAP